MKRGGLTGDKTGQFYLVAAIIISVIVIGFVSMSNYSRRPATISTQNIAQELSIESEKVLDYATYNGFDEKQAMKDFAFNYTANLREGKDSYFLFGNSGIITVVGYSPEAKTIYINNKGMSLQANQISSQDFSSPSSTTTLTIDNKNYDFELKSGENLYYIMFEESGGEEHVIRN